MLALEWMTEIGPLLILVVGALVVVVWLVLTRVFTNTRAGRHAAHFLDAGGADTPPEDQAKFKSQRPGSGGYG